MATSFVPLPTPASLLLSGSSASKPLKLCLLSFHPSKFPLSIRASADGESPNTAGIFIGGFVLGGLVVGGLACIYAPQISIVLAGTHRRDLLTKLPKFIYDEEKALEKTRKILTEKIEQLNAAIDDVSAQLRTDDARKDTHLSSDESEASV